MNEELEKYIDERSQKSGGGPPSIEELNMWVGEFMSSYNKRSLDQFEGYSPENMYSIIHGLWSEASVVKMKKLEDVEFDKVPIFRQAIYLLSTLLCEGKIKLTATKAIPPKIVKEIYALGTPQDDIESGVSKLSKELDAQSVQIVRYLLKTSKYIKEQKGVLTLTKKGEKAINDKQKLLEDLLYTFTCQYNFACFDGYSSEAAAGLGNGFSLILIAKYGDIKRSAKFYSDKYYAAFPKLLEEFVETYNSVDKIALRCYKVRTFERYMVHFGLVDIEKERGYDSDTFITKTELFDKLIYIVKPMN